MMYVGDSGIYTYTFGLERKDDCPVCGTRKRIITIPIHATVQDLMDILAEEPEMY